MKLPEPDIKVEPIAHLGLVADLIKRYRIIETTDYLLPKVSGNQNLTHGEVLTAMIYLGLGLNGTSTYQAESFFKDLPLDLLFREGVRHSFFKKDVFGETLDAIYEYGDCNFFCDLAFTTCLEHNLIGRLFRLDSSSFSQGKRKNKSVDEIHITYGHSKDHRQDLPQIIQTLITTDGGVPMWSKTHSGNANDREIFGQTISEFHKKLCGDNRGHFLYLADSALYNKAFLMNKKLHVNWITRVPTTIAKAKKILESEYSERLLWTKVDNNYKYMEFVLSYASVKQRWILVRNRKAKYKELATFAKNRQKDVVRIEKMIKRFEKRVYYSKEEAELDKVKLKEQFIFYKFNVKITGFYKKQKGLKRPIRVGYQVKISYSENHDKIERAKATKGRFILATNILDEEDISSLEVLNKYRGQSGEMESCFRFMKDSTYKLNTIFQTKPERIVAMMQVVSMILFINNIGQRELRESLQESKNTVSGQLGKPTARPTIKWAFQLLKRVYKTKTTIGKKVYEKFQGIERNQLLIINAFGPLARNIYGFT